MARHPVVARVTRLALASLGTGYTLGIATIALFGDNAQVGLGFSAGIASCALVVLLAGCAIGYVFRPTPEVPEERRSVEL